MKIKDLIGVLGFSTNVRVFVRNGFENDSYLFEGPLKLLPNVLNEREIKFMYPWKDLTLYIGVLEEK